MIAIKTQMSPSCLTFKTITILWGKLVPIVFSHSNAFLIRRQVGGATVGVLPLVDRSGILFSFMEGDHCLTLGLICHLSSDGLVPAWGVVPMRTPINKRPFAQGSLVVSPSKFPGILFHTRDPSIYHTSVIGKLVHGVSLDHEDGWVADGAAMRQPGED